VAKLQEAGIATIGLIAKARAVLFCIFLFASNTPPMTLPPLSPALHHHPLITTPTQVPTKTLLAIKGFSDAKVWMWAMR